MNTLPPTDLAALNSLPDYRVRGEDSDPRGWSVADANGVTVGTVTDLIIDVDGLVARYMVCALTREARAVLLPVGFARFDAQHNEVRLEFLTATTIEELPGFGGLPLSAEEEARTQQALTGMTPSSPQAKIVRRSEETRDAS